MQLTQALGKAKEATASAGKFTKTLVRLHNFICSYTKKIFHLQPSEPAPKRTKKTKVNTSHIVTLGFVTFCVYV